jgi:mannose-1-phosphate guanylyltransferase
MLRVFFFLEPEGRNTAPAIVIAAFWIKEHYGANASMLILPADHNIQDQREFNLKAGHAVSPNNNNHQPPYLVTFGIKPHSTDTNLGYKKFGKFLSKGFVVLRFYEKPGLKNAEKFCMSEKFFGTLVFFVLKLLNFYKK